ncbi:HNH endonuclease [Citrobacter sp. FDAARGOS_156]|uniref:HNH endonuclease n=1 Tax=Citrobacter sp. FDAARGOS_156 TaxID=1702170 RepID=UPI001F21D25B|nr:HNH endonuclease [Citrobacter sp. FDAARGOS_156]
MFIKSPVLCCGENITFNQVAKFTVPLQGKSRHERGYGSKWDIKRARILKRDNHLCQNCLRTGRAVAATTVDHIKAKAHGGTDDDSNLESLCWPCHRSKTGREHIK